MPAEREIVAQQFNVVVGEADLHACLVAASLLRSATGKHANGGGPEALEDDLDCLAESVAIREEQHNGCDPPSHSGHGQQSASEVVAHGGIGLFEEIAMHSYSLRSASTGSSSAARRAGYSPAATPATPSETIANAAVEATNLGGSKPSPRLTLDSAAISAAAPAMPKPPLSMVKKAPSTKNWNMMLLFVAPTALRRPISRVRSATATSMMLMIPIAPSARVTRPTLPRNMFMASKIFPIWSTVFTVSHSSNESGLRGSKPWFRAMILCTSCFAVSCKARDLGW